jgi:type IV secretory pathway VirB10-like protein
MTEALNSRVAALGSGSTGGLGSLGAAAAAAAGELDPNGQKNKNEFLKNEQTGKYGYLINSRQAALSAYEAKAGTVIPAVLVSGVNSDLPGMIIAQVSQDVYDTANGRYLLIPQGTKLLGSYDSLVTFGQNRAAVIWNKLTFPDASTLFLGNMPGADQAGYSGFQDKVNHHYLRAFGSALLVSVFGAGIQLSQPTPSGNTLRPSAQEELAAEVGRQMGQFGMEIARKNLNTQPTIEIRPGYRFVVMVNKDLVLEPYSPKPPRLQPQ